MAKLRVDWEDIVKKARPGMISREEAVRQVGEETIKNLDNKGTPPYFNQLPGGVCELPMSVHAVTADFKNVTVTVYYHQDYEVFVEELDIENLDWTASGYIID